MSTQTPEELLNALKSCFASDPDTLTRVIYFLCPSKDKGTAEPYIRALSCVMDMPKVFKQVAERFANDTKTAEENKVFRRVMADIWNNFMKDGFEQLKESGQEWQLAASQSTMSTVFEVTLIHAVSKMSPEQYCDVMSFVRAMGTNSILVRSSCMAMERARMARPIVQVALVVVTLAVDVIRNIRRWWIGEISGKRCVKNLIDHGVNVAAGIAGGMGCQIVCASIGSTMGPVGAGIGSVLGAIFGSAASTIAAQVLTDRLTQWIFGLPKSEALENAYNFLDTPASASNSDINSRYRHLALQYHPDKGGDPAKWTKLQYSMAVIREARGEY